jgi:hypothetical protein
MDICLGKPILEEIVYIVLLLYFLWVTIIIGLMKFLFDLTGLSSPRKVYIPIENRDLNERG